MKDLIGKFDHPIVFVFFIFLAVKGISALVTWGAKEAGWNGLATMTQLS